MPPAFRRHAAARYAVVRLDKAPPRLVAATWFKHEDVVYFLANVLGPELGIEGGPLPVRILDMKEGVELTWTGGARLHRGDVLAT